MRSKIRTSEGNKFAYQIVKNSMLALACECVGFMVDEATMQSPSGRKDALFNAFISEELNFPDMSFFGKFFKRIVGVSPKTFRTQRD